MPRLSDSIPEPTGNWTTDHEPNPLEGIVLERREVARTSTTSPSPFLRWARRVDALTKSLAAVAIWPLSSAATTLNRATRLLFSFGD